MVIVLTFCDASRGYVRKREKPESRGIYVRFNPGGATNAQSQILVSIAHASLLEEANSPIIYDRDGMMTLRYLR
jgi:hypothetical protein